MKLEKRQFGYYERQTKHLEKTDKPRKVKDQFPRNTKLSRKTMLSFQPRQSSASNQGKAQLPTNSKLSFQQKQIFNPD
jgi:phosphopantetheinyl transferase